jgi:hypothetical protein
MRWSVPSTNSRTVPADTNPGPSKDAPNLTNFSPITDTSSRNLHHAKTKENLRQLSESGLVPAQPEIREAERGAVEKHYPPSLKKIPCWPPTIEEIALLAMRRDGNLNRRCLMVPTARIEIVDEFFSHRFVQQLGHLLVMDEALRRSASNGRREDVP